MDGSTPLKEPIYTPDELRRTFDTVKNYRKGHIKGVVEIKGSRGTGDRLVVSALTHGNEVSGLAAIRYLLDPKNQIVDRLRGTVVLTVNNLMAAEKYFRAETEAEKLKTRQHQMNMNRLRREILTTRGNAHEEYEVKRARELMPVWEDAAAGVDLHSTSQKSKPMLIDVKGTPQALDHMSDGIPIEDRYQNIMPLMNGITVASLFGGTNEAIPAVAIECGSHHDPESIRTAIQSVVACLVEFGMLEGYETESRSSDQNIYRVEQAVNFPNYNWKMSKIYPNYTPIQEGEILASGPEGYIISNLNGQALFGCPRVNADPDINSIDEEQLFVMSDPVARNRTLHEPKIIL